MSKDERKRRLLIADNVLGDCGGSGIRVHARPDKIDDEIGRNQMTRARGGIALRDSNSPAISASRDRMTKQQWADLSWVDEVVVSDAVNALGLRKTVASVTTVARFAWGVTHVSE
jgi:hypothetical protein